MNVRLIIAGAAALTAVALSGCEDRARPAEVPTADPNTATTEVTIYAFISDEHGYSVVPVTVDTGSPVPADPADAAQVAVSALLAHDPDEDRETMWHGPCAPVAKSGVIEQVEIAEEVVTVHLRGFRSPPVYRADCDPTPAGNAMLQQQMAWTIRTATDLRTPVTVVFDDDAEAGFGPVEADSAPFKP